MVTITALWLPIVLSAVLVFIASSVHPHGAAVSQERLRRLPNEDKT